MNKQSTYSIMEGIGLDEYMRYYTFGDPNDRQSWLGGEKFTSMELLSLPIVVEIRDGMEDLEESPFLDTPPVMSNAFYDALCEAGVTNIDVYDAVLQSEDGEVKIEGYKAFNVIGMVSENDPTKTLSSKDHKNKSAFLPFDESKMGGLLLFRLEESHTSIVVHESVRKHIKSKHFGNIQFVNS